MKFWAAIFVLVAGLCAGGVAAQGEGRSAAAGACLSMSHVYHISPSSVTPASFGPNIHWSPDGALLATNADYTVVTLRDATTGTALRVLEGSDEPFGLDIVVFSPDSTRIAGVSLIGRVIRVWDTASGALLYELTGHTQEITEVAWSPEGALLASGSKGGLIKMWDAVNGVPLRHFSGQSEGITALAWSQNGALLASAAGDGAIRIWNPYTGEERQVLRWEAGTPSVIAWSNDGTQLLAANRNALAVWNPASGELITGTALSANSYIYDTAFSPDASHLALSLGFPSLGIAVWDTSGEVFSMNDQRLGIVHSVAWSPDGTRLALGREAHRVQVLDAATGVEVQAMDWIDEWRDAAGEVLPSSGALEGDVLWVAWSPDGTRLAASDFDGRIIVWACE